MDEAREMVRNIFLTWHTPLIIIDPEASLWMHLKSVFADLQIEIPNPDFPYSAEFRSAIDDGLIHRDTLNFATIRLKRQLVIWARNPLAPDDFANVDVKAFLTVFPRYRALFDLQEATLPASPTEVRHGELLCISSHLDEHQRQKLFDYVLELDATYPEEVIRRR